MLDAKTIQQQTNRFFDWVDTDIGLRTLIAIIRTGVALALVFYFIPMLRDNNQQNKHVLILVSLASFAIYTLIFGLDVLREPRLMQAPTIKVAQPVAEIGFYIWFYLLSGNSWSDLFFLCFLPLFLAFRYFSMRLALIILALTALSFSAALYIIKVTIPLETFLFIRTLLARNFFLLLFPTLFYSVRHRLSVMEAVRRESSELANAFDFLGSGVLAIDHQRQILYVNQFLRARHGNVIKGQTCASYLCCHGSSCGWCTQLASNNESSPVNNSR